METDRETIHGLLTDTVVLLCRNSLPFDKSLKVQGLLGITVDETDVYIVQIDEELGDALLPETLVHSLPPRTRMPIGRTATKRPRVTSVARTPIRRMAQTVPLRMGPRIGAMSPGNALARQKVRQQLNFPTPHKIPQMAPIPAASPRMAKPVFVRGSPMSSSQGSASQAFAQTSPPVFQQSPRMPSNQKPAKFRRIEEKKVTPKDRSPAIATGQTSRKQMLKVEKPDSFGQSSLKMERLHGDIICVESDEENTDVKRSHGFPGNQQSAMESMVDDKTVALQAIMAQALNKARAVSSGSDDNFHVSGMYAVKSEGGGRSEFMQMKAEPVSSSQSIEPVTIYDIGEDDGGTQCHGDFDGGLDVKPVFNDDQLQNPWEMGGGSKQSESSLAYSRPASRTRVSAARPVESMQWIKTEDEQGRGMMPKSSTPGRVPFYQATDPGRTFSSPPQHLWGGQSGMNVANSGVESADDHSQEASGNWKPFAAGDFICSVDNCGKEFATKRLLLRHQKTAHGTASEDGGSDTADASNKEAFRCNLAND